MHAMRLHQFGDADQLIWEQLATPIPGPGELVIDLASAGVNPIDWKTRQGGGAAPFQGEPPLTLGWECAGTVHSCGEGVNDLAEGQRVCGLLNFPEPGRCYAEQTLAKAEHLARVPESLDLVEMGGLPLSGLTAWQALFEVGRLQQGQRVLVLAAAGGVGHLAVQLAKWKGAEVIGTASSANHGWLAELGCDRLIDYHQQDVTEAVSDADLLLDGMGGDSGIAALACLRPGGLSVTLPSVTAAQVIEAAQARGCRAEAVRVAPNGEQLTQLVELVEQGGLRLRVDKIIPLQQVAEAHRYSETGRARGKIILRI